MIITDQDLLKEVVDFLLGSENNNVENMRTDYFYTVAYDDWSFVEWVTYLFDTAMDEDKFMPDWSNSVKRSILLKSLLADPESEAELRAQYEDYFELYEETEEDE